MAGQCLVIAIIIMAIYVSFLKSHRNKWAYCALPLVFMPVVDALLYYIGYFFKIDVSFMVKMSGILIAVVVSCIWMGACSMKFIANNKQRLSYLGITIPYTILLAVILVNYHYQTFIATRR